jgi:hypothetical protein
MKRGLSILWGDFGENLRSGHLHQYAKAQVATVAIAIALTHQGLGAIVLAFDKAITQANGQEIKERQISCRQSRKADKALRSSAGPSRLTVAIQASNSMAAVVAVVVAYQVRKASLRCQASAISGKAAAKVARACSSSAVRSCWLRKKRWNWPSQAHLPSAFFAQRPSTFFTALSTC